MPDYLPKWRYMEAGIFGLMMSFAMCDIYIDTVCDFPYTGKSGYANVNVWNVLKQEESSGFFLQLHLCRRSAFIRYFPLD